MFIVYWFYKSFIVYISSIPFLPVPRLSSGILPGNQDIPHTGPLLGAPCHSRLPDRSRMYHGLSVQSGTPVRSRSVLAQPHSVYVRLSVAVAVVLGKESPLAGSMAAVGKDALLRLAVCLLLVLSGCLEQVGYMSRLFHMQVEVFLVESVVIPAVLLSQAKGSVAQAC